MVDQQSTYDEKGSNSVGLSQPGSGLNKRQCTLQIHITPVDKQNLPPGIVVRGNGSVSHKEKKCI